MRGTAAIIGGGIGGLATAIALHRFGWQVTVHERDASIPGTGTALGMWPSALRALDSLGIGNDVRSRGRPQQGGEFRRPDGSTIGVMDTARMQRRTGDAVYLLSRPALLGLLRQAAEQTDLRFGSPINDVAELGDQDVVVAADGVFSTTRQRLFGARYQARFTGSTAWRGYVDNMPTDAFVETWGAGAKFGVTPQEGGRTNWYATIRATERDFAPDAELANLRRIFGMWAAPVGTVLDALEEADVLRHDVYVTPPLPTFVHGNVALIGDAAHAMTPDLGRGACEALIDAVALADCLAAASTVPQGLRAYDRARRRPAQRLARVASTAARLVHVRHAVGLRDLLLRASLAGGPPG
ncbi:FAD-dependent oxidoreductase [Couchioplanes caeruleus]|uniref:2-polyprenyl-6-methoxyphenol hydroxylase n=2 Tax=Couchioplanes caeruleus TaxID=56438 RepID=A0A1K0FIM7_9ACTN|nr:FAD-dependent oxidoreductase [Couchioplanes caeruleus]OJF12693.1 2-polyprenyl-6-methoxyphenol hydroxylase [Couchioplanes caeruleus subsp. caeruleus]ROP28055.1 2-polyprenyl-6-methoxyphenol hydroxylase-like FAD-dependent oxidoreductase [Couchioplanes caeruleus]